MSTPTPDSRQPLVPSAKFALGRVVSTPGALDALRRSGESATPYIERHHRGDWGEVPPEDAAENETGVVQGYRILSVYRLRDDTRIWVVTQADRSSTCVLLPDEY